MEPKSGDEMPLFMVIAGRLTVPPGSARTSAIVSHREPDLCHPSMIFAPIVVGVDVVDVVIGGPCKFSPNNPSIYIKHKNNHK